MLFVTASEPLAATAQLAVLRLDTGEVTRLGLAGLSPRYVSTGHLVYATEDGSVRAASFDATRLEITGNPVPVIEGVIVKPTGAADFAISDQGIFVYISGTGGGGAQRSLVWVNRDGREVAIAAPPRPYVYPRVSPDGARVAVFIADQESDIWLWDGVTLTRLTFDDATDHYPHWTPDGRRVVFSSNRNGPSNVFWKAADGTGTAERLTESDDAQSVNAVTPDGSHVVIRARVAGRADDLRTVSLEGDHATVASRAPSHGVTGCGGRQRRSPTGGAAYRMPR